MKREECFAILRVDDGQHVSVKIIVWDQDEAEREVARLNGLNNVKGCLYSWVTTRAQLREEEKDTEEKVDAIGRLEAVKDLVRFWESYAEDLEDSDNSMRRIQALVATPGARKGTDESEPEETLYWHCVGCGNHELTPIDKHGDARPCSSCENGVARVMTMKEAAALEQSVALGALITPRVEPAPAEGAA